MLSALPNVFAGQIAPYRFLFNCVLTLPPSEHLGLGRIIRLSMCNTGLLGKVTGCEVSKDSSQEGFTKPPLGQHQACPSEIDLASFDTR